MNSLGVDRSCSISAGAPAEFETAISATGFGKFNILLLLMAMPSGWAFQFESTTMSYVFPAAQCDLDLSLANKGTLNAITYSGMILTSFLWGFIIDLIGRRKVLIIGFLSDVFLVITSSFSQSFAMLVVAKFLGGAISVGLSAALTTYLCEMHSTKYRARVQMYLGSVFGMGNLVLPLLASGILPLDINVSLFNGSLQYHSWNLYILLAALPGLTAGITFIFLPDSPKFLMSKGKNQEAMEVFKRIYATNSGKSEDSFPILKLIEEVANFDKKAYDKISTVDHVRNGLKQMYPLFHKPYLSKLVLVCTMQMSFIMCVNTLRLWLPQMFSAINSYQLSHNGSTADLCTMLDVLRPTEELDKKCTVDVDNFTIYLNSITVGLVTVVGYGIAGTLINIFRKKTLITTLGICSGLCAMCLYFSQNTATTLALASLNLTLANISADVLVSITVVSFPTSLRAMAVTLPGMVSRSGSIIGNLVFPLLLMAGCAPPFFLLGSIIMGVSLLAFLLPDTDKSSLK